MTLSMDFFGTLCSNVYSGRNRQT